ncbi:MAG: glycosyltransferase family 4 protein [Saprospiraceae bacterium]|nr:glycosyltransferase family 4 protein [Saprospiraceae bacterium]
MKIGFDAKRLFQNNTGLGNYSRTLVGNLHQYYPDYQLYLYTPRIVKNERTLPFYAGDYPVITPGGLRRPGWRSRGITSDIRRSRLDLYHGLSHELPMNIAKAKIPTIVTMHDLLYKFFPMDFPFLDRMIYDKKFRHACKTADLVIAISQATKKDIVEHYGTSPEKIRVVCQTVSPVFSTIPGEEELITVREKYNLPSEFILYVGAITRRKNIEVLIRALDLIPSNKRLPLVIVGNGSIYLEYTEHLIADLKLENDIIRIKSPRLDELNVIYRLAALSVYPSLMEGFGLPVLESIVCGTPVITTRRSSLTEAGGKIAYYIDGEDEEELAALIQEKYDSKCGFSSNPAVQEHLDLFKPEYLTGQLNELYKELVK